MTVGPGLDAQPLRNSNPEECKGGRAGVNTNTICYLNKCHGMLSIFLVKLQGYICFDLLGYWFVEYIHCISND